MKIHYLVVGLPRTYKTILEYLDNIFKRYEIIYYFMNDYLNIFEKYIVSVDATFLDVLKSIKHPLSIKSRVGNEQYIHFKKK